MKFGMVLPQYGPTAPHEVTAAARQAEDLGFADVWVSDHLAFPNRGTYFASYVMEAMCTLSFAAATTSRVGLGTAVLVLPYRHPILTAKQAATVDQLSGGRLILGVGAGFLEDEFRALNADYQRRGHVTDEYLQALKACWTEGPTTFSGDTIQIEDMKLKPKPVTRIPLIAGGSGARAVRRAVEHCDGWQGAYVSKRGQTHNPPSMTAEIVKRIRDKRPEDDFLISMRIDRDPILHDMDELRRDLDSFREVGVQHIVCSPTQRTLDGWLKSVDGLWNVFSEFA